MPKGNEQVRDATLTVLVLCCHCRVCDKQLACLGETGMDLGSQLQNTLPYTSKRLRSIQAARLSRCRAPRRTGKVAFGL